MNYYIQGNKEKADQIKAAFEKLGYDISWSGGCANPDVINIGVERNGAKYVIAETAEYIKDIIKTHPDYKELELPIEPKFKVGDWAIDKYVTNCVFQITKILDNSYEITEKDGHVTNCLQCDIEDNSHLWTIADIKDGDVLALNGKPFIYSSHKYGKNYCYIDEWGQLRVNFSLVFEGNYVCPATKQERDLLFSKMREVGYEWDADKKELHKIKSHYDIANFKPFDKVLVRDEDDGKWMAAFYSHYMYEEKDYPYQFATIGTDIYGQCIPFEGNEHLFRTTDMCPEEYINW